MICNDTPGAYIVWHLWNGEWKKFITLNYQAAVEYAAKWHGRVGTLHEPILEPTVKEIKC